MRNTIRRLKAMFGLYLYRTNSCCDISGLAVEDIKKGDLVMIDKNLLCQFRATASQQITDEQAGVIFDITT